MAGDKQRTGNLRWLPSQERHVENGYDVLCTCSWSRPGADTKFVTELREFGRLVVLQASD